MGGDGLDVVPCWTGWTGMIRIEQVDEEGATVLGERTPPSLTPSLLPLHQADTHITLCSDDTDTQLSHFHAIQH